MASEWRQRPPALLSARSNHTMTGKTQPPTGGGQTAPDEFDFGLLDLTGVSPAPYYIPKPPAVLRLASDEASVLSGDPDPRLTLAAQERLLATLRAGGNTLSREHEMACLSMLSRMTRHALRHEVGRICVALPPGAGKTQGVVAWIAAAHAIGLLGAYSVAIAAHRVESLTDILRSLVDSQGVPREAIGLMHSKGYDPKLAERAKKKEITLPARLATERGDDDAHDRPVLLATHSRIRMNVEEQFNRYRLEPRSLLIWDESLFRSEAAAMSLQALVWASDGLARYLAQRPKSRQFITDAMVLLEAAAARQASGLPPQALSLGERDFDAIDAELLALREQFHDDSRRKSVDDLREFAEMARERLTFRKTRQGSGLIAYRIAVSPSLDSVISLDASYPIRSLLHLDRTLRPELTFDPSLKRFDNVVIKHIRAGSGRTAVRKSIEEDGELGDFPQFVAEIVREHVPDDEGVIVFTFKHRGGPADPTTAIRDALLQAGYNLAETLPGGQRRFNLLTWGYETSLSNLTHCSHVIFAGVLNRSTLDIAASMIGQSDDLLLKLSDDDLEAHLLAEKAHVVFQGANRGSCRQIDGHQAHPMTVWLPVPDDRMRPLLEKVMPGVRWEPFESASLGKLTKVDKIALRIADYLRGLPASVKWLASVELAKAVPELAAEGHATVRSKAIARGAELAGWVKQKGGKVVERA